MKIGYADPPYIGCADLYKDHPDFAGEVDHKQLIVRLEDEFDGWVLHASAPSIEGDVVRELQFVDEGQNAGHRKERIAA